MVKAIVNDNGRYRGRVRKTDESFRWDPPGLPASALPVKVPPIVEDMDRLLKEAGSLGLAADEGEALRSVRAIERAITVHDTNTLLRARPWLDKQLEKLRPGEAA